MTTSTPWDRLVGVPVAPSEFAWTPQTVLLYHLGVGVDPGSDTGLTYLLESSETVLPAFATLTCFPALIHLDTVPGLHHVDLARVLHAQHAVELHGPIPSTGAVSTQGHIAAVTVRGPNLHVAVEQRSRRTDGTVAWTNRYIMVCRDAAGHAPGGTRHAARSPVRAERLRAAVEVDTFLAPNLAHIYRHSGDDNPLHLDPAYARRGGFDAPILHGLCTLGAATRAVVDTMLDRPERIRRVGVRFSNVVKPGSTLSTVMRERADGVEFEAWVGEQRVLERGGIEFA